MPQIEDESVPTGEEDRPEEEIYPEKPRDENSDPLPKTDLTEEEIAQLILDEEEVLNEKGVLGWVSKICNSEIERSLMINYNILKNVK